METNKENFVQLVDENDQPVGIMEKYEAHKKAALHRAISVFIVNSKGDWLIHRRALDKYHSNGLWTNATCSHPYPDESYLEAAKRRLKYEMGINCELIPLFHFIYQEKVNDELTEHELDYVFFGVSDDVPIHNTGEVEEWKYIPYRQLLEDVENHPEKYTVWFKIIMKKVKAYIDTENLTESSCR
jgi:isopentenyl-diphosphate delta-isomerase